MLNVCLAQKNTLPEIHYKRVDFLLKVVREAVFNGDYKAFIRNGRGALDGISTVFPLVIHDKLWDFYAFLEDSFNGIEDNDLPETITELAVFSKTVGERDAERKALFETLCKNENPSV